LSTFFVKAKILVLGVPIRTPTGHSSAALQSTRFRRCGTLLALSTALPTADRQLISATTWYDALELEPLSV